MTDILILLTLLLQDLHHSQSLGYCARRSTGWTLISFATNLLGVTKVRTSDLALPIFTCRPRENDLSRHKET